MCRCGSGDPCQVEPPPDRSLDAERSIAQSCSFGAGRGRPSWLGKPPCMQTNQIEDQDLVRAIFPACRQPSGQLAIYRSIKARVEKKT